MDVTTGVQPGVWTYLSVFRGYGKRRHESSSSWHITRWGQFPTDHESFADRMYLKQLQAHASLISHTAVEDHSLEDPDSAVRLGLGRTEDLRQYLLPSGAFS